MRLYLRVKKQKQLKELVVDLDLEWVKHLLVDKKVNLLEVDQEFHLGSKVVKLQSVITTFAYKNPD